MDANGNKTGGRKKGGRNKVTRDVQAFVDQIFKARDPVKAFDEIMVKLDEGLNAMETKLFQSEGMVTDERDLIAWDTRREYAKVKAYLMVRLLEYRYGKAPQPLEVTGELNFTDVVRQARERVLNRDK